MKKCTHALFLFLGNLKILGQSFQGEKIKDSAIYIKKRINTYAYAT